MKISKNLLTRIIVIIISINLLVSNSVYPFDSLEGYHLAQDSKAPRILNERKIIHAIILIYDICGFENGKMHADTIESTERIKESLRRRLREDECLDEFMEIIDKIEEIFLSKDRLIYVKYRANGREVLFRLTTDAPGEQDEYQVVGHSDAIIDGYRLQIVEYITAPRGWEGLANEDYTPAVREALAKKEFVCIEYNTEAGRFKAARFRYDNGSEGYGNLNLPQGDLDRLNDAMVQLEEFYRQSLVGPDSYTMHPSQIIFMRNQSGHYGISRNQYYLDIEILNNPDLFKAKLLHEIKERMEVVTHKNYQCWRVHRGEEEVEKSIKDLAYKVHTRLLKEEKEIRIKEAFNILEEAFEKTAGENIELGKIWSGLSSCAQNIRKAKRLLFAAPFNVLRNSPDMTAALRKLGKMNRDRIFELIIYDVENEETAEELKYVLRKMLGSNDNMRIYTITKGQIAIRNNGDYPDNLENKISILKGIIKDLYPLKSDEYLAIATDMVRKGEMDYFQTALGARLEPNLSVQLIEEPGDSMIISFASMLSQWLKNLSEDNTSSVSIVLPVPVGPKEFWEQLENLRKNAWQVLSSA